MCVGGRLTRWPKSSTKCILNRFVVAWVGVAVWLQQKQQLMVVVEHHPTHHHICQAAKLCKHAPLHTLSLITTKFPVVHLKIEKLCHQLSISPRMVHLHNIM